MSEYQEFTGKTVEEALRNARESFGVGGLDDLDFEILTAGSRGVLGMGAEPARIVAAPRSALGGAAPRRDAAASVPLPAPPPREERGYGDRDRGYGDRGRDRYGRGFDRGRERGPGGDRGRGPSGPRPDQHETYEQQEQHEPSQAPIEQPAMEQPVGAAPVTDQPDSSGAPRHDRGDRGDRRDRGYGRDRGRGRRDDGRGSGLSQREQAEVNSARQSLGAEREEIQAAEASPEALDAGKEILEQLIGLMGYHANVSVHSGETSKIDVTGSDDEEREALGALIGRKGERLSALQHLVNLMLSRRMGTWTRVLVDVEDYRGRRERQLTELAHRAAERVIASGTMLQLEPMPALERRWIHLALKGVPGVATQSIGEEPQRRIVVLKVGD
jgi:spoIIIJ-associated protein